MILWDGSCVVHEEYKTKALIKLKNKFPDILYIIAGEGSEKAYLQRVVNSFDLNNHVFFAGNVNEKQKKQLFKNTTLMVMPTLDESHNRSIEGFGIAYLEAAFFRIPSIASNIGGTPEAVINNKTGIIIDDIKLLHSSIKQLYDWGRKNKKSLEDSAAELIQLNKIKPKAKLSLVKILQMFNKWRSELKQKKHYELMEIILDESGYSRMLKDKKDLESEGRLENLKELIRGMHDFDNLQGFLEHVALATSIDQDWDGQKVNLMTIHAAKGLEFDAVFLPGWEEGLFPHQKSIEEKGQKGLEEERRLAYVGITRAKKQAIISFSMNRFYQGDWIDSLVSRFIDELPHENIKKNNYFEEDGADDFDFNQDIDFEDEIKSPGWIRYQKKLKR